MNEDEDEIEISEDNPNPIFKTPNFVARLYQKLYNSSKEMQSIFPPHQDKSKYGYPLLTSIKIRELKETITNRGGFPSLSSHWTFLPHSLSFYKPHCYNRQKRSRRSFLQLQSKHPP